MVPLVALGCSSEVAPADPARVDLASSADPITRPAIQVGDRDAVRVILDVRSIVRSLAFSGDGGKLAVSTDSGVSLWDVTFDARPVALESANGLVSGAVLSPDGSRLFVAALRLDPLAGLVRLLDATSGKTIRTLLEHPHPIQGLTVRPDGSVLAVATRPHPGDPKAASVVLLLDPDHGELRGKLDVEAEDAGRMAFAPDGATLAIGINRRGANFTTNGEVTLWDFAGARVRARARDPLGGIFALAFEPEGDRLFVAATDPAGRSIVRCLKAVDGSTDCETSGGRPGTVCALAVLASAGKLVAGGRDGSLHLLDPRTLEVRTIEPTPHRTEVLALAVSPNGQVLASGSADRTVRLWDVPKLLKSEDPSRT